MTGKDDALFATQCREMFARAEMRWMSVEEAEITVPARLLALVGRQLEAAREDVEFVDAYCSDTLNDEQISAALRRWDGRRG